MTWLGVVIILDLTFSIYYFVAHNEERKPLTARELAFKVVSHIFYIIAIIFVGTGSL